MMNYKGNSLTEGGEAPFNKFPSPNKIPLMQLIAPFGEGGRKADG